MGVARINLRATAAALSGKFSSVERSPEQGQRRDYTIAVEFMRFRRLYSDGAVITFNTILAVVLLSVVAWGLFRAKDAATIARERRAIASDTYLWRRHQARVSRHERLRIR